MVTPEDALKKLKLAESKLDSDVERIIKQLKVQIINLLRVDQLLEKGINPDGLTIGVYSKATEQIGKNNTGPGYPKRAGSPYNFLDTGEMFSSYDIEVGKDTFTIVNTSLSLDLFLDKFGLDSDNVVGLTKENQEKVNWELILPKLREIFRRNL